jgi:hypothetical protein
MSPLPSMWSEEVQTVGSLRSTSIPPLHHDDGPFRPPLIFGRFPGVSGYTTYLAPPFSRREEEGFSSCLACPCLHAVAPTPPEWVSRVSQSPAPHTAFAFTVAGSASGAAHLRGHLCVRLRYGLATRPHPEDGLSRGFRRLVSRPPALQATGLWLFPW